MCAWVDGGKQWRTRATATGVGMCTQFSLGGVYFLLQGYEQALHLEHSMLATVVCPLLIEFEDASR